MAAHNDALLSSTSLCKAVLQPLQLLLRYTTVEVAEALPWTLHVRRTAFVLLTASMQLSALSMMAYPLVAAAGHAMLFSSLPASRWLCAVMLVT